MHAAYRMAPHTSTRFSPFFLIYGRENVAPIDAQLGTPIANAKSKLPEHVRNSLRRISEAREAAEINTAKIQARNGRCAHRSDHHVSWSVGDRAWLHCPQVPVGTSPKLQFVRIRAGRRRWFVHPSRFKTFVPPRLAPSPPQIGLPKSDMSDEPRAARLRDDRPKGSVLPPTLSEPLTADVNSDPDRADPAAKEPSAPPSLPCRPACRPRKSRKLFLSRIRRCGLTPRCLDFVEFPTRCS